MEIDKSVESIGLGMPPMINIQNHTEDTLVQLKKSEKLFCNIMTEIDKELDKIKNKLEDVKDEEKNKHFASIMKKYDFLKLLGEMITLTKDEIMDIINDDAYHRTSISFLYVYKQEANILVNRAEATLRMLEKF